MHAQQLLRAAARDAKAADHLVEHEQRAGRVGALAQQLQEAVGGGHEAHVRRQRLGDDRRELVALGRRDAAPRGRSTGTTIVRRGGAGRHARARGQRLRRQAGAGLREQPVGVAVVGARELEDRLAAGGGAREADRGHRRLGARGGHAQHLDALHPAGDLGGELDLAGRRRAEARARSRPPRRSRASTCGWACPWISGPHEQT